MAKNKSKNSRQDVIVKTSVIGILANCFLAAFKAITALASNSISVLLDAVNNLSDALSSVITIVGTKLAGKPADKKHPFGYGRIEYLSAMIISVIILYAGITSIVESIKKIITPSNPNYSNISLIIITIAILVKILLGLYVKHTGKKVNSDSLSASGQDALMDSIISAGTLVTALIFKFTGLSLESYLGLIISCFIIKSGIEMLRKTLSEILGERVESSLAKEIKKTVSSIPGIQGAYDLVLNNYGPDKFLASIHIEVPDVWTADKIDEVTRTIQTLVYKEHNVYITAVGIYSVNTKNDEARLVKEKIQRIVMSHEHVLQMHGFYFDKNAKLISLDVVIDFASKDRKAVYCSIYDNLQKEFPDYSINMQMDDDISD